LTEFYSLLVPNPEKLTYPCMIDGSSFITRRPPAATLPQPISERWNPFNSFDDTPQVLLLTYRHSQGSTLVSTFSPYTVTASRLPRKSPLRVREYDVQGFLEPPSPTYQPPFFSPYQAARTAESRLHLVCGVLSASSPSVTAMVHSSYLTFVDFTSPLISVLLQPFLFVVFFSALDASTKFWPGLSATALWPHTPALPFPAQGRRVE